MKEKLDQITFGGDVRGWLEIDGKKYWVVTDRNGDIGSVWVHRNPGDVAIAYATGRALTEGDNAANHEFALDVIRGQLALPASY